MSHHPLATTTPYRVREVQKTTPSQWDGWMRGSPGGGHVLQSYHWAEFKKHQRWSPLRLTLERDGEVVRAGQFLLYNTLPVPGYLMYAPKGPWLPWDDAAAVGAFFEGVYEVARSRGVHTVKIEPEVSVEREDVRSLLGELGFRKARYDLNFDATIVVDLTPSEEELFQRMKGKKGKTTRYNIRQGLKGGVEVVEPEDFEWAWEVFQGWMEDMEERKEGFTIRRPRQYFYDMMRTMHDAGRGRFFFAVYEGEPLAGAYVFTFGEKLWYMHGASSRNKRNLRGDYLIQWEMMRWARERGMTYYDMVGVPRQENRNEEAPYYGVYKFKKVFGGEITDFLGCFDLPVRKARAAAWYELEPFYYRLYLKLGKNIFY